MSENKLSFGHGFCSWNILLFYYAGKKFGRAYFQSKSRIKCCQKVLFAAGIGTKSSGATGSVHSYYATCVDRKWRPPEDSIAATVRRLASPHCYYRGSYFIDEESVFADWNSVKT